MRALAVRLLAAGAGLVLALVIGEIGVRLLTEPPAATPADAEDTRASTSRAPHFRAAAPEPEKAPGVFRVLVIGDSFTWGWGVSWDKTYAFRLAKWLPRLDSEVEFEVVNWSRPGWNTWEEWLSVRDQLDVWDPDLLIVGYVFNDAESTDLRVREAAREGLARRTPRGAIGSRLYRWSRLVQRVTGALENRRMRRELTAYYYGLYEGDGWDASKRGLRRLRGAAQERDIPLLLVLFPIFDSQLDDAYAYRGLHELVATTARNLKIPYLDLLPFYEGIDGRELAVVPFTDAHPSPLAHRIAAKAILDHLVASEMIPARMPDGDGNGDG
jgi:lysophospholipase L1-like esterase